MRHRPDVVSGLLWWGKRPWRSPEDLARFQTERMTHLVTHAYDTVPFYRRLFDHHHVNPREIRSRADLANIPIISKRDLRSENPADLIAQPFRRKQLIPATTSGSAGAPFTVRRTWFEQNLQHLFRLRAHRALGVRARDRIAYVRAVRAPHQDDSKMLGNLLQILGMYRGIRVSVLLEPEKILSRLSSYGPDVVISYPSTLARLAMHLSDGAWNVRPRVLIAGAEQLTPVVKDRVSTRFQAPVFSLYGCNEFNLVAWECRETGAMHICDDSLIVEIVGAGRPAAAGEAGDIVVTSLHSYAMPFVRYKVGDVAVRGQDRCSCGAPFSTLSQIHGRTADYLRLPGGRMVHPFEVFEVILRLNAAAWIGQHQLVQEREDSIRLLIAPLGAVPAGAATDLADAIAAFLGNDVSVRIELVREIELDPTGKTPVCRTVATAGSDGHSPNQAPAAPPGKH